MLTIAGGVLLGLGVFCALAWVATWLAAVAADVPGTEPETEDGVRGLRWVYLGLVGAVLLYALVSP